ncbi:MAG: hypothetical protein IJS71_00875 [Clostridia bacterium]|nr:hypothetical protein [Clostridia bacterium]
MNALNKLLVFAALLPAAISCTPKTEKYAQNEHGKKFGPWEINYNAGDYDVYWPSLKLTDDVEGALREVVTDRNWWSGAIIRRDTTSTAASLGIIIYSVKSKNDARYYNSVRFRVANPKKTYRSGLEHRFIFNEGQKDSLSFAATSNSDDYFVPERVVSEQILTLFSEKKPISVKVICSSSTYDGAYTFDMEGSPKLKQALKLNEDRKIFANKEFSKANSKAEKEFMKMLQ